MGYKPGTDESMIRHRPLKVYAFDPSRGRTLGNYMTINVEYEDVQPGPLGKYLHVIDYDATHDCYYLPIDLTDRKIMIQGGLDPNESDPRFHQQMVYAVVSETIRRFEFALGRKIVWAFERRVVEEYDERKPLREIRRHRTAHAAQADEAVGEGARAHRTEFTVAGRPLRETRIGAGLTTGMQRCIGVLLSVVDLTQPGCLGLAGFGSGIMPSFLPGVTWSWFTSERRARASEVIE